VNGPLRDAEAEASERRRGAGTAAV